MDMNQPTLIQFEGARKANNMIPPEGSNSFYTVGSGEINLLTKAASPENPKFDIFTNKGDLYTGVGNFSISGDPYENMNVIAHTKLSVNHMLTVSGGNLEIHGILELMSHSQLIVRNNAHVIMYVDSTFSVNDDTKILVEKGSSIVIYGQINIHLSMVDALVNVDGITIDSAAVMNVEGMDQLGERPFSLTDYEAYLRNIPINVNTQGEMNSVEGRIGYTWKGGSPKESSRVITMSVLWGEAVMGDFKLSVLGEPESIIPELQVLNAIKVNKRCTLYVSEEYRGKRYIRPNLYLGLIISNNKTPADCIIDGTIIVDGPGSSITVDRGSTIHINEGGELWLKNKSHIYSTHNSSDDNIFFIDGTLYIDDIEQIKTFEHDNIVIGKTGKVVVYNPDTGEKRLLWKTPNEIENTDLYRLFKDRIDHVEYHISNNTGIGIDQYYDFYAREFTNWYGGRRIEKAIHDGILVWHDGGFIELYNDIIPWVNTDCTLLEASRIFKTFGSFDPDKLQEAVNRLKYAGAGNIVFRFVEDDSVSEVTMVLNGIKMKSVLNHPLTDMYVLTTDNDGKLFLRNKVTKSTVDNIVNENSRQLEIENNQVEFQL